MKSKKIVFRAFPWLRQGRALVRRKNVLAAIFALTAIPNALLSCKAKDTTNNSGAMAAIAAKSAEPTPVAPDTTTDSSSNLSGSQPVFSPSSNTGPSATPDLDLTKMSSTMIYTTIFDMLIMPEDYVEKTIKVKGWFETYTDPETSEMFYAVIVPDATACCQQGLEFIWPGTHTYPSDFPNPGEDITITGRYKVLENNGVTYTYLEASKIEF